MFLLQVLFLAQSNQGNHEVLIPEALNRLSKHDLPCIGLNSPSDLSLITPFFDTLTPFETQSGTLKLTITHPNNTITEQSSEFSFNGQDNLVTLDLSKRFSAIKVEVLDDQGTTIAELDRTIPRPACAADDSWEEAHIFYDMTAHTQPHSNAGGHSFFNSNLSRLLSSQPVIDRSVSSSMRQASQRPY